LAQCERVFVRRTVSRGDGYFYVNRALGFSVLARPEDNVIGALDPFSDAGRRAA
jgi:hypothetical protein